MSKPKYCTLVALRKKQGDDEAPGLVMLVGTSLLWQTDTG
jgi:hypothetical protein